MNIVKKIMATVIISLTMASSANAGNYIFFTDYRHVFQVAFDGQ